ncbi:uncharacterized protein LOC126681043 [Mercurialis annua]|uniref:uncharacterized protein LOC126681043 n=1 Tax=Mercurialis annua TaxID=3986 RepID=UPI00215DDC53|nr:uncharacterized protein LOC126681043 [Mercurialis annua]
MKLVVFLPWLLILCNHAISNKAFQETPTSLQHQDFTLPDKQVQVHDGLKNGMKEYEENHEIFHSVKGRTGGHGNSNIVHQPGPNQKSAATLTAKPAFFLSAIFMIVNLYASFGLEFDRFSYSHT